MRTRSPRGLPCPHDLADEFRAWVGVAAFEDLLGAWESRTWYRFGGTTVDSDFYRIDPGMLEHLKRRLAELVVRDHGGACRSRGTILRSDGERVWMEMSPGLIRMKNHDGVIP